MGILSNTVSICQFRAIGEIPGHQELFEWVSERLSRNGFRSIEDSAEEVSTGWVQVDDHSDSSFSSPAAFWRDHYLVFTLRRDQRRIPAPLLKAYVREEHDQFLAANPGLRRVPKQRREELLEKVRLSLLVRTLPVPSTFDAVWDTRSNIVTFTALGAKPVEIFENLFKKTFDGVRLVAVHPYSRAADVIGDELLPALQKANQATTDAVLDLIKSNQWIGNDFLLWLMYRSMNGTPSCMVNRPGPGDAGTGFTAYINDRLVLVGGGEEGMQKVTVAGPQDHFTEVRTALAGGKRISEATIYLEQDEHAWRLTLKGEPFHFASFRAPAVKIEKGDDVDAVSEREAVFFERMYLLERGLQLFDSLYSAFLQERLGAEWPGREGEIGNWLEEELPRK
ncbi:recombination-associated protein RdgC [Geobacter sp. DSM 9736]|uniref:recombination-associated protein RdgC n=1 Tax=Geobacter sp. DSM 9736 TaxID=1277350 RepID=UPI000B4FE16E|nr:recombination-associated protein RdgC [Geobacter sp. DSM 9736]SNB46970.1 Putative exonuclease, RdgC [Geobacter sp. DSM 9736]